jgi:hypothetical protein
MSLFVALCIVHKSPSAAQRLLSSLFRVTSTFFFRGGLFLATGLHCATLVAAAPTRGADPATLMPVTAMSIKEVSVLVKRLPLLTQTNFLDWNLAFQLFAVSLGLGAILWPGLYQFAAPTAVDDTDTNTTPVSDTTTSEVVKKGRRGRSKVRKNSEEKIDESTTQNAESHSAVTGEVVFQQTPAVDESLAAARQIVSRQASLVEEAKAIRYAYTVLMSTVSPSLQYLVRCVPYGSLTAAYQAVEQFFIINDNTSRWRMRASFNSLEMQPDEDFLSFCGKIQYMASQINALENKQVIGDSEMTLCLTNGVLRHHNETFYNILTILGRQQGLTFQEAKSQMLPDAHRARNRLKLLTRRYPVEPCSQPKKNVEILLVVVVAMVTHVPDCMKPPPSNAILVAVRAMSSATVERSRTATRNALILPTMTPK